MKKVFFALMALSLVCVAFTSCDKDSGFTADPTTQPIAGKTYRETASADSYSQFSFHMNYRCTMEAKRPGEAPVANSYFEWWMSPNDNEVVIRYAQGAYDKTTGYSLSGQKFLSRSYNATQKTVTLSGDFDGKHFTYTLTEQN